MGQVLFSGKTFLIQLFLESVQYEKLLWIFKMQLMILVFLNINYLGTICYGVEWECDVWLIYVYFIWYLMLGGCFNINSLRVM